MQELVEASARVKSQRQKIDAIEASIRSELETFEPEIEHFYAHGLYGRKMKVKAGSVVVGKIHKYESLNIMSMGSALMLMDDGTTCEVCAGLHVIGKPGTRRVAYFLEDSIWTTMHGTELKEVAEIEKFFIAQTPEEFQLFCDEQTKLPGGAS